MSVGPLPSCTRLGTNFHASRSPYLMAVKLVPVSWLRVSLSHHRLFEKPRGTAVASPRAHGARGQGRTRKAVCDLAGKPHATSLCPNGVTATLVCGKRHPGG